MTPKLLPAAPPSHSGIVLALTLLWVLTFLGLSVASLTFNSRLDGPPVLFSHLVPVVAGALVGGLYGLIRQL